MNNINQLLSTIQAAELIGCSKHTLDNSRCTGELMGAPAPKYIKFGYAVRYKRETVLNWVENLIETASEIEVVKRKKTSPKRY